MITFYPGPSKVYPVVEHFLNEAFHEGVLSINHRSQACMQITRTAIDLLHQKLHIPSDYTIYFVSSATEVWEIIAQSLTQHHSTHIYNGAFGEKWADYAERILPKVSRLTFGVEELISAVNLPKETPDVVCITHNETSNGTQVKEWPEVQKAYPEALIAVDVTSSMAGVQLNWQEADIWFASVQKCFGLPAGMAIMVCSPRALVRAEQIGDRKYYNSLLFIHDNFKKYQTHYTPNVLEIFLLSKVLPLLPDISETNARIEAQASAWYTFFDENFDTDVTTGSVRPLVNVAALRSNTVLAIEGLPEVITRLKKAFEQTGITVGNGYGAWKNTTFRIANFPAISEADILALQEQLLILLPEKALSPST
ncbi:aminotransferase class V-fold PLP-dependent enzyme [Flectobacillus major]|jgi:phosphoserine aminotransferase|uniref:aminotransferase class V-fold PLP-dependent enzyme n=1 Tax=Flectobacillus major TaxID=103 RepID=UPI00040CDBD8|nr:aminotransferase class V-fold PLP-dependent enzyme [Flectobacillus major]